MRTVNRWFVAAVLIVVALAVVGTLVRPTARAARTPVGTLAPVAAVSMVCPSLNGGPGGASTQMTVGTSTPGHPVSVSYLPLVAGGRSRPLAVRPAAAVTATTPGGAVAVSAEGPGAGAVGASQVTLTPSGVRRALTDTACAAPATDWWFAGVDGSIGKTDLIVLSNPGDAGANVALSLWSAKGPLSPPKADSINVGPRASLVLPVANLAPDVPTLAMHVHANSGTVTASVLDMRTDGVRPLGVDWIPPTAAPASTAVVTGYVAGAAVDVLCLANPGDHDATVTLRVTTPTRSFQPAGHQTVVVPAGRTTWVDLTSAAGGEVAAAQLSSDTPVVAQGFTLIRTPHAFDEFAWLAAQPPLRSPAVVAANAAPFGRHAALVLTAPRGQAKVQVSNAGGAHATVTVAAGRTASVDLAALLHAGGAGPGPVELTPVGTEPLYVVRILYAPGAHGALLSAEMPTVLPPATVLPPVVPDLRAATR